MSKFDKITFPFFGLRKPPKKIKYQYDKLYIQEVGSQLWLLADDLALEESNYFTRLAQLDINERLVFDVTALNLQQLILAKVKWGIDISGKIHDFKPLQKFPTKSVLFERKRKNLIWLKNISYPFEMPTYLKDTTIQTLKELHFRIINISDVWYILSIDYKANNTKYIRI